MPEFKLKLRDLAKKTISLPTNQKHKIVVTPPKAFVLDAEDAHFNFDRSVLLPELASVDGSVPVLDARRVTGLGVVFAALTHAKKHPSQGLFVAGHTDAAGAASYNQTLSEERARGVSLLLRGKRDDWRKASAKDDAVDDVQTVLTWQAVRAGWPCDPEGIDNDLGPKTREAVRAFQERYNLEVDRASDEGLDSPFKAKITVDGVPGAETWGAFYDLYMTELMSLLDLEAYADLQQLQGQLKAASGMKDFVGCGEHIPFNPARRFEDEKGTDEHDGPQRNPSDRRVEILFLDPGEEVDLVCHPKPGQCKPAECPVYVKVPHRQIPIEIPKGVEIMEVNLKLTFVDPEGKVRPFPEGLPVAAKFGEPAIVDPKVVSEVPIIDDDDEDEDAADAAPPEAPAADEPESMEVPQEPTATVGPNGLLQFTIPRRGSSLFLVLLAGAEKRFVTADPRKLDDQKLASADEARAAVGEGRLFFRLPEELNTRDAYFDLPSPGGVTFKDGAFQGVNVKQTELGTRDAPLELRLAIHWQHFTFEYFDRWTSSRATVPQANTKDAAGKAAPPVVLEGVSRLLDADFTFVGVEAASAWTIAPGKDAVHCLAWVQREIRKDKPRRELPDDKCTVRFEALDVFVRTDGDGAAADAPRACVSFDAADKTPRTPGLERLRLYDLPPEWRSRVYPARLGGETVDKSRSFEQVAGQKSALDKPYVASLDVIVLQATNNIGPEKTLAFDDSKLENRLAIFDNQLKVYKAEPASGESYFTRVASLSPKPTSAVLIDAPPFTRLIARGGHLFDVFDRRTRPMSPFKDFPVGARLARHFNISVGPTNLTATTFAGPFTTARPDATNGPTPIGDSATAILRCCGREKDVELFNVIQYLCVTFDFPATFTAAMHAKGDPILKKATPLAAPPPDAVRRARDCLVQVADRWNGRDSFNKTPATFEIGAGPKARGRYLAFLSRGAFDPAVDLIAGQARLNVFDKGRAFMLARSPDPAAPQSGAEGFWALKDLEPDLTSGWFTAAHEVGHIFGQPDEYTNTDFQPSYDQPNIGEGNRSAGAPYGRDGFAMMVGNVQVRSRYFWDLLLFARENSHFVDAKPSEILVKRAGGPTFSADVTPLDQNRVRFPRFPQAAQLNDFLEIPVGTRGLCDAFVYVTGQDGFTAGNIDNTATASPYDGFIIVRVKMDWKVTTTSDYDEINKLMERVITVVRAEFNESRGLRVRTTIDGKAVRLRVLFAPRLVGSTFPDGDNEKYLTGLGLAKPFQAAAYQSLVDTALAAKVHVEVKIAAGAPGVTGDGAVPRTALVRPNRFFIDLFGTARFDDDLATMFALMIGAPSPVTGTIADYAALVQALSVKIGAPVLPELVSS